MWSLIKKKWRTSITDLLLFRPWLLSPCSLPTHMPCSRHWSTVPLMYILFYPPKLLSFMFFFPLHKRELTHSRNSMNGGGSYLLWMTKQWVKESAWKKNPYEMCRLTAKPHTHTHTHTNSKLQGLSTSCISLIAFCEGKLHSLDKSFFNFNFSNWAM
jgi:hypothetical protein